MGNLAAAMFVAGIMCAATGVAYYFLTQDAPEGNFRELRAKGLMPEQKSVNGTFLEACKDRRVWALFVIYGACFGIELTINKKKPRFKRSRAFEQQNRRGQL